MLTETTNYLAHPTAGARRGVLVLHAWWGLTPFFRSVCDRLATAGFIALAPDLYHGATAATIPQAEKLRTRLKKSQVSAEIIQTAAQLQGLCGQETIGVVGFSLGAYWGLWLAEQPGSPAGALVSFYGTRGGDYAASRAAFQFHLAENDPYTAASGARKLEKALRAAGKQAEFYTYPGTGHWFFESDRPEAYDAAAAKLAWERTVKFLAG